MGVMPKAHIRPHASSDDGLPGETLCLSQLCAEVSPMLSKFLCPLLALDETLLGGVGVGAGRFCCGVGVGAEGGWMGSLFAAVGGTEVGSLFQLEVAGIGELC